MEAQIEIAVPDPRGDGIGAESSNRYLHLWVGSAKSLEKKRQIKIRTEALQNAQMQPSANDAVLRADCRDSGLECRECGTGVFQEQSACLGQGDPACRAFNESRSEFQLQFLDGGGESRLHDVHPLRRPGEAALFRKSDEVLKMTYFHGDRSLPIHPHYRYLISESFVLRLNRITARLLNCELSFADGRKQEVICDERGRRDEIYTDEAGLLFMLKSLEGLREAIVGRRVMVG
jgi:hypothetical protein